MRWVWAVVFVLMMACAAAASPLVPATAQSNAIRIIDPELIGPGNRVTVLIADGGLDASANRIDEYEAEDVELVTFGTDRSEVQEAVPDLEETGENTGIFAFEIDLVTEEQACEDDDLGDTRFEAQGGSDPSIGVCPGDTLFIEYDDGDAVVSSSVTINSWDPEFVADRDSYSPSDRIAIDFTDPDANRDPDIADSIRDIRVYSDRDPAGEEFSALETGDDTGVFRLTFTTSTSSQGNAILVDVHGDVFVEYIDEFPADFAATTEEKTFVFTFVVTSGDTGPMLTPSVPQFSANGAPAAGKQATLSMLIANDAAEPQSFVQIVEVRDSEGVTVYLAWQSGNLESKSQTQIGVSWTPDRPGDYEVRTFAVSGFDNPQVLSVVATSDFTVE